MKKTSAEFLELKKLKAEIEEKRANARKSNAEARAVEVKYFFAHVKTMVILCGVVLAYNYDKFDTIVKILKSF